MPLGIRRAAVAGFALALSVALAACTTTAQQTPTDTTAAPAAAHNAADTEFAQMMIIHHEGAIEMADLAVQRATTPEVTALGERITAAQGPEIDLMTGWLQEWGEPVNPDMAGMDHGGMDMDGMDQAAAMEELAGLTGVDVDRRFLDLMTAHHEGAITMARAVIDAGQNPDVQQLAQQIVDAQTAEIAEMAKLRAGLPG
ncbi:MAG: DUF305 domain-containing protein [Propionicimonas sp.]